jgi:molecular chaperone GrpE
MSGRRDPRTTPDPVDGVYELELDDTSPAEALREAVAAVDPALGQDPEGEPPAGGVTEPSDELAAMREKYLRALADFDNYRKRVERERGETSRAALQDPLREFLKVMDNLDRALRAGGSHEDLRSGLEMILRQTGDLLRRYGVEEFEAVGEPFDPARHEAVVRVEDLGVDEQTVSEEYQKGYTYHGRLLRPAMVKVAVPPDAGGPGGDGGNGRG